MARDIEDPTADGDGEVHPAFGLIGVHRVSNTPGSVLFDSDIRHARSMVVSIKTASRRRQLNRDWIREDRLQFEVEMSEAQWAAFVSSPNSGSGVPCTIRVTPDNFHVPGLPYDPRLAHSMKETRDAADQAFSEIQEAMAAYDALDSKAPAKQRKEALSMLRATIRNATPNVEYAGKTLVEHTENVVAKAKADIEAIVTAKAAQLQLDPAQVGDILAIEGGRDEQ